MTNFASPVVFDGHNDVLTRLLRAGGVAALDGYVAGCDGHIDHPRSKIGGFGGGFFAIWCPTDEGPVDRADAMTEGHYDVPLPPMTSEAAALQNTMAEAAILMEMERRGLLRICRSAADIRASLAEGMMAAIFHIEGAEAIGSDLSALEVLYAAGLRSLGPVWSRETIFGHGVPFRFPSSPDTGPGLTDAGKRLVRRCNELGVMIDLSHLNEAGFWDVAKLSKAPLVASHSNAHALCPVTRNLTDRQLAAIRESDGLVGVNFATAFLREDGQTNADTPLETVMLHLDYLIEKLGETRVALGSDFDGATTPEDLNGVQGLPLLRKAMKDRGYDENLIRGICHENWLRVLEKTWGE